MRTFIVILGVLLVACLVSSVPVDPKRWLINRPTSGEIFGPYERLRRAEAPAVKGAPYPRRLRRPGTPGNLYPTKGEYVCGNKICKLTPGVEPPGCNGICQYPILPKLS